MRRFTVALLFGFALVAAGCEEGPTVTEPGMELAPSFAVAGGPIATAVGSGHLPSGLDDERIFAFSARRSADGSASGQFTLMITTPVFGSENPSITRIEAEVTCMSISGSTAWVGGVVKNASNPAWLGQETGWVVYDDGEGPGSVDRISLMDVPTTPGRAQLVCDSQSRVPDLPIEHGNVQVSQGGPGSGVFFPFSAWIGTCGEVVEVNGYFHPVFHFTADRAGGFHAKGHFNATGTGIGLSTGAIYNWNDAINFQESFRPPQGTFTSQQSFSLIGRGDAPDLRIHALFHVTVTPNGVVDITADRFTQTCG